MRAIKINCSLRVYSSSRRTGISSKRYQCCNSRTNRFKTQVGTSRGITECPFSGSQVTVALAVLLVAHFCQLGKQEDLGRPSTLCTQVFSLNGGKKCKKLPIVIPRYLSPHQGFLKTTCTSNIKNPKIQYSSAFVEEATQKQGMLSHQQTLLDIVKHIMQLHAYAGEAILFFKHKSFITI